MGQYLNPDVQYSMLEPTSLSSDKIICMQMMLEISADSPRVRVQATNSIIHSLFCYLFICSTQNMSAKSV